MKPVEVKLDDLYQEVILHHNRRPSHFYDVPNPTAYAHGHNPLCGDDYHVKIKATGDTINDIGLQGSGCAISKASGDMMAEFLSGKSIETAKQLSGTFVQALTGGNVSQPEFNTLGPLKIFEGVKQFPVRVKCATLAWHALEDALKDIK